MKACRAPGGSSSISNRAGDLAQRVRDPADHSVSAQRGHGLPGPRGLDRKLAGVVEVTGVLAPHHQPLTAQRAVHPGRQTPSPTAPSGGVDDQPDGRRHGASVVAWAPYPSVRGTI